MSEHLNGDKRRAPRTPKAVEKMGIDRDLGALESRVGEHEKRMDRTDLANSAIFTSINARFDGIGAHLNKQDETLSLILQRTARDDGAIAMKRESLAVLGTGAVIVAGLVGSLIQAHWHFW